jgi:hypothetical protein
VLIGDYNVTDSISSEGYASASIDLDPSSMNTVIISVDTANYRKNVFELKVQRPLMEVPIELKDPTNWTTDKSVKIEGSTEPGATITTNASKSISINKSTGMFSFTAALKAWGWNDITITATSASGRTSTMIHRVNRQWEEGSYSAIAQLLNGADYAYLLVATKALTGRVYRLDGTVVRKIESDISDYYLFYAGETGDLQPLVLEYTGEKGLNPGQLYRIFADVTGETLENYPVLSVKIVQQPPSESAAASPSPGASPVATASPTASSGNTN